MLEKKLEEIVIKEKDILPFLKIITPKEKRALVPFLKKFKEKVFETKTIEKKSKWGLSYTYEPTHTEKQRDLVSKACFVCYNKTDARRTLSSHEFIKDDYIKNIIPWYTPKWYSDLVNEEMPWSLSYEKMMNLYKKGLLTPSHALILAKLPHAIVESKWENEKNKSFYKPQVLYLHPETLDEHIWFLFEEESGINNYYNYLHLENYEGGNDIWIDTITYLTTEKKIDRVKILIATIYSATKGFNKTLSGWFFDLLIKLNPTPDEVLSLQNEFFTVLNSPHSKVINTGLKYFKTVAHQEKFKSNVFVENTSILLSSEIKSVVNSTLMILEKIARTRKEKRLSVCIKTAEALISTDEKTQLRAAKIIEKYGNSEEQDLLDEVSLYTNNLFHSSKDILNKYINSFEELKEENYDVEEVQVLSKENELPTYDSLDDLIFFVSQSIDNNQVYDIDLLLCYLPKLYVLLDKGNVAKLEPIFKRSLDLSMNYEWNSQIGNLESEAAYYLNDFAEIMMKKYPLELDNFRKVKNKKIKKLKEDRYFNSHYKDNLKEIEHQSIPDYIYQVHHFLFIKSKSFIKKGYTLELLSTPTHAPCWIDLEVLIERILAYEKRDEEIDLYDFQIAIGRLPANEYTADVLKKIDKIKVNDIQKVLKYHFGQLEIQNQSISKPELWVQSVLSRNKSSEIMYFQEFLANPLRIEMGIYDWNCKLTDHFYNEYDYTTGKQVQKKMIKKELKFKEFELQKNKPESIVSNVFYFFKKKKKAIKIASIYEYIYFKKETYNITIEPNDGVKFLFLTPNNPSVFLSQVIHHNLKESTFFDESSKKNMINLLKGLYEIWCRDDFKESTYLFLATGLLCSDKIARELAAEIWIKSNAENKMNNELLGQILGKLELNEYAPLKRFTDLLTTSLFKISKKHNESLYCLLDCMIANMHAIPIRGVKKLLEIFLELKLTFPQLEIGQVSLEKRGQWKETKTLKTLIDKI